MGELHNLNPYRTVTFDANVNLRRARLELEKCHVVAQIDLQRKEVIDMRVELYGSDYTRYVPDGEYRDLESEALYHAGILQ